MHGPARARCCLELLVDRARSVPAGAATARGRPQRAARPCARAARPPRPRPPRERPTAAAAAARFQARQLRLWRLHRCVSDALRIPCQHALPLKCTRCMKARRWTWPWQVGLIPFQTPLAWSTGALLKVFASALPGNPRARRIAERHSTAAMRTRNPASAHESLKEAVIDICAPAACIRSRQSSSSSSAARRTRSSALNVSWYPASAACRGASRVRPRCWPRAAPP
jgi:hypothetical protein